MLKTPKYLPYTLILFVMSTFLVSQAIAADFVGSKTCVSCHEKATQDWQGSDHDMSMKHADSKSVFGERLFT